MEKILKNGACKLGIFNREFQIWIFNWGFKIKKSLTQNPGEIYPTATTDFNLRVDFCFSIRLRNVENYSPRPRASIEVT